MSPWIFALLVAISNSTPLLCGAIHIFHPARSVLSWMLQVGAGIVIVVLASGLARWDVFGTDVRIAILAILLLLLLRKAWAQFSTKSPRVSLDWTLPLSLLYLLAVAAAAAHVLGAPSEPAIALEMPLHDTTWYTTQGGSTGVTNHHHAVPAQRHALDIVVLGPRGTRAKGMLPENLREYQAYGMPVSAPCAGRVSAVRNDAPDQAIGTTSAADPAGNHVAIACKGVTVVLAHLRPGSVSVNLGDRVEAGKAIGEIGNSGNTSEPHLHIHAVRGEPSDMHELLFTGEGVPMLFAGRYLRRGAQP